jgi:hypothetical protein
VFKTYFGINYFKDVSELKKSGIDVCMFSSDSYMKAYNLGKNSGIFQKNSQIITEEELHFISVDEFDDNLPFLTVQIAPFPYAYSEGCTQLVTQQIRAAKEIDNVFMITSNDIGEKDNIHPLNKKCIASSDIISLADAKIFNKKISFKKRFATFFNAIWKMI